MAFVEEFWDILKQIHNNDGLHAGVKKTFARVRTYADCIKLAGLSWTLGPEYLLLPAKKCC